MSNLSQYSCYNCYSCTLIALKCLICNIACLMLIQLVKMRIIWNKDFKSGPSKICDRQPLKYLKDLLQADQTPSNFLKAVFQILLDPFLNTLSHFLSLLLTIILISTSLPFGESVAAGMECIVGSWINFESTGISLVNMQV